MNRRASDRLQGRFDETGADRVVDSEAKPERPAPSPHMTGAEVRAAIDDLANGDDNMKRARTAQLAWRPAWAIRSRRGACGAVREWLTRSTG